MRITLPNVFALFIALFISMNFASGNNPNEDFCFNADLPEAQMDFSVMCLTAPTLSCPSTYLGCLNDNLDPSIIGMASALPGDQFCPQPIVTFTDDVVTNTACMRVIHRTWDATYPAGSASIKLHSSCQQTILLEDTGIPVINNCPSDLTVDLAGNCDGTAIWNIPTATDDCGIQSFTTTHFSGASFPLGTTQVTYTARDFCNNVTTCSFNVIVSGDCCQAPTISCPSSVTICPGSNTDPASTGTATFATSDPSCPFPTLTFNDNNMNVAGCNGTNRMITRTWTVTDPTNSSFTNSCVQTISSVDNQNPVVTNIPSDMNISASGMNCSAVVNWIAPTATDNCGLASFTTTHQPGSVFPMGSTLVTYTAIDNCGNSATGAFQVTIQCIGCNANPNLTCPSNFVGCPNATTPQPSVAGFASASAGSNMCGSPVVTFSDSVISSGSCLDRIVQRTWTATDPVSGNFTRSCVQLITLVDTQPPSITNVPNDITVSGTGSGCTVVATWIEPTITDACGIVNSSSNLISGTAFSQGTSTVTYTATDNCGNVSNASFTVTVQCGTACNTLPTISCPANYTACPILGVPSTSITGNANATSGSSSCAFPTIAFSDLIVSSGPCPTARVIQRTFTATNPSNSNLSASCVQTISLQDNQNPRFLTCPSNVTVSSTGTNCSAAATWGTVLATDNCVTPSISSVNQNGQFVSSGSTFSQGLNTVTYTAMDGCGNTATCSFTVTVNCTAVCDVAPVITCPAPIANLCLGADISISALGSAVATGGVNCSAINIAFSDQTVSQSNCNRVITRTFIATYVSGSNLTSSCNQRISMSDNVAPVLLNCPSDIVVSNPSTVVTWTPPTATDQCGSTTITSNFNPGTTFSNGITTVVYTAVDGCGNSTSCSFNVVVNSNSSITCPDNVVFTCGSNGGAIIDFPDPTINGTCSLCDQQDNIPGFIYMGSFNGNQYYCSLSPASWADANIISQNNGGTLACITSPEENAFLANQLTIQSAWIGLNDIEEEGNFVWPCGDPLSYTNWFPGQPNNFNGNQNCVEILNNGQWNDQYETYQLEFIMERPCTVVQQVAGPAPGSFQSGGDFTVTYQVSDACGSLDQCSFTVTVEEGLSISCPSDISTSAPSNSSGVAVDWDLPQVSSCCSNCGSGSGQQIPGFVYMGSFNGHHYYCSLAPASWPQARQVCEDNGGYLAVINNSAENAYIANLLTLQSAWIGCYDEQTEGTFQWVNGDPLSYTNWYPGQPNNYTGNQDYVEMLNNGQWNDQYNHFSLEYILEIPGCVNLAQIGGPTSGSILPPGTSHTVTYRATDGCGNTETCSFDIEVASIPVGNGYCPSRGENSSNFFIESFLFNNINNYSGNNGGYKDFSNAGCSVVRPGVSYPLQLDPGFAGVTPTKMFWKVWIDYNLDGDFDDASEFAAFGCGSNTLAGTITMPSHIWNGSTLLRVAMKAGSYPTSPCDIFPYGEVEDYCIYIEGGNDITDAAEIEKRSQSVLEVVLLSEDITTAEVDVYPNPVSEYLMINLNNIDNVSSVELYTIDGKMIHNTQNIDLRNQINVSQYESGLYLLRVAHTNGEITTKKITIQH